MPNINEIRKKQEFWEFIEWMSLPANSREPKTQKELAQKLGVDYATLSDWKKVDGFWDEVKKRRKVWVREKVSNILLGLYGKALKGDTAAARMLMEYADEFVEVSEIKHKIESNLTEEEKQAINEAIKYATNKGITTEDLRKPDIQENSGE